MAGSRQVRDWVENAGHARVGSAAVAVLVLAAFVVASIVTAPGLDNAATLAGTVSAAPTLDNPQGLVPSESSDATADTTAVGPDESAPAGPGASASPSTSGGDSGTDAAPATELVASDRGVTEDTIAIGAISINNALEDAGFSTGTRDDLDRYLEALAAYQNERGGAAGRTIELTVRPTDPTSTSDQAAACQSMLNDRKVFGVIDLALSNGPAQGCIAQQGQTPYAHSIVWSSEWQAVSGGYDVGYLPAIDRISHALVRDLVASGWIDEGNVVGLFGDNCPTTKPTVDNVLVPLLEATGARVEVGLHDCTIGAVFQQPPNIATRFRTAGVDRVITVANYVSTQVFTETAAGLGGWDPDYAASDWFTGVSDSLSANYNPRQFDGAVGITTTRDPLINAGRPAHDGFARCDEAATEYGLPPLSGKSIGAHLLACDLFFLMIDGIDAAGPNPTRPAWAAAIQSLGSKQSVIVGMSSFGPGKTDGADQVYSATWHADCRCWKATSDLRSIDG